MSLFYIISFGIIGILARYYISVLFSTIAGGTFPLGTFGINILGSFLIGVVYVLAAEKAQISPQLRLGLMVGLLGGFTTFSAYSLETLRLIEESRYFHAAVYWMLSPVLGLGAAFCGALLVRKTMGS